MITEKLPSKLRGIISQGLMAIGVALLMAGTQKYNAISMAALLGILLLASWLIARFNLHHSFLMILAFILPFSVELPITAQIKILIPSEPMLAITIFALGWEALKKPSLLGELFAGESRWAIPLLLCFLITSVFSTMLSVSVKFSIINSGYILVFFLWQKLLFKDRPDLFPKLMVLFSLSQIVVLIFSFYQLSGYDWNTVTIKAIFRPFYKDHTIFGATGAMLSVFWLLYTLKANSLRLKFIFAVLGLIFLSGVFLSYSRAAFLSLVFSALVWVALQLRVRMKHIALGALLGLLLLGFFQRQLVQLLYTNKNLSHDSSSSYLERIESSGNISTDISNLERLNRWYAGIQMAMEKPLTGFGPGTYQFNYIDYQSPRLMNRLTVRNYWHIPENSGGTAHSEYILALSEMGFFGLAALLLWIGRWVWMSFEKVNIHSHRINILIAMSVLSTYLFHGTFNNFLNTDKFAFLFWGFAAWMAANYETDTPNSSA